ncbi:hypothetical protein [Nostoc edaphicum]|nr:hypothetical protein [Nostoc edaphicum]
MRSLSPSLRDAPRTASLKIIATDDRSLGVRSLFHAKIYLIYQPPNHL